MKFCARKSTVLFKNYKTPRIVGYLLSLATLYLVPINVLSSVLSSHIHAHDAFGQFYELQTKQNYLIYDLAKEWHRKRPYLGPLRAPRKKV